MSATSRDPRLRSARPPGPGSALLVDPVRPVEDGRDIRPEVGAVGALDQSSVTAPTGADIFPEIIVEAYTLGIQGWVLWMVGIEIRDHHTTRRMAYDILSDPNVRSLRPRRGATLVDGPDEHRKPGLRLGPGVLEDVPLNQDAPPQLQLE